MPVAHPRHETGDREALLRYLDETTAEVRSALRKRLSTYRRQGRDWRELGSARQLSQKMLATIPEPSRWDEIIGPFYSVRQMSRLLGGISRQALADRRERRTLLGLKTADGVVVYPCFQLDEHHRVVAGLPEVLRCFRAEEVDEWTIAGWLVSSQRALDAQSPIRWLQLGKDRETVVALARDASRRFAE